VNLNSETLPTGQNAAMASGDFTAPGMPTIYDPTTQTIQYTGSHTYQSAAYITGNNPAGTVTQVCPCVIRQSFADEYHNGNRITAFMINPRASSAQMTSNSGRTRSSRALTEARTTLSPTTMRLRLC